MGVIALKTRQESENSATPGQRINTSPRLHVASTSSKKILIVEDEAIISLGIARDLEGFGYTVVDTVTSGEEAVARAQILEPDLVLMDIRLSGEIDGITAAQQICLHRKIPIVYLTSFSDAQTVARAGNSALYGFVTKPYRPRELHAVMQIALAKYSVECTWDALRASEKLFHGAFTHAANGMALVATDDTILQANPALCTLLGYTEAELLAVPYSSIVEPAHRERDAAVLGSLRENKTQKCQLEQQYIRRDGHPIWVLVSISPVCGDGAPPCIVYQVHDISERRRADAQLQWHAHFDALTGLYNRARFLAEVERAIAQSMRHHERVGLLFFDLDYFKCVNEALGHESGDRVLELTGKRLREAARETDIVGRIGGDEFVVLVTGANCEVDVLTAANNIRTVITEPMLLDGREFAITSSVGIALFPDHGCDAKTLLRNADRALYSAKAAGRNEIRLYHDDLADPSFPPPVVRSAIVLPANPFLADMGADLWPLAPDGLDGAGNPGVPGE